MSELTVILKDEDRTYRKKYLSYDTFSVSENDPFIMECIADAMNDFQGTPDEVRIQISMSL